MIVSMHTKDETLDHTYSNHTQSQKTQKVEGPELQTLHKITKTSLDSNTFYNNTRNNDTLIITQKTLNDEGYHVKLLNLNATQQVKSQMSDTPLENLILTKNHSRRRTSTQIKRLNIEKRYLNIQVEKRRKSL